MSGTRPLDSIQRWFQAVITHAGGAEGGILSEEAQAAIRLPAAGAESVIGRSARQSALERLAIYSNAYYARLLECLGDSFPVLKQTLGGELFDSFAFEYLQHYPSRSYTLDLLGEHFTAFLAETRPAPEEGAGAGWPDFLIELASLEWTIGRVFDGPGAEGETLLTPEMLAAFPAGRFAEARLKPVPSFLLLSFRFPVSAYFTAARRANPEEPPPMPDAKTERIAMFRRDYVVRRYPLTAAQFALLQKLQGGCAVGDAIAAAVDAGLEEDPAFALPSWFRFWAAEGFFAALSLD